MANYWEDPGLSPAPGEMAFRNLNRQPLPALTDTGPQRDPGQWPQSRTSEPRQANPWGNATSSPGGWAQPRTINMEPQGGNVWAAPNQGQPWFTGFTPQNTQAPSMPGGYSPFDSRLIQEQKDRATRDISRNMGGAAAARGAIGSSVFQRNMNEVIGNQLNAIDQSALNRADQNYWQQLSRNDALFRTGLDDVYRRQGQEASIGSQDLRDYLAYQELQNRMYWQPIEFGYQVSSDDATRRAAGLAGQSDFWGNVLAAGGNALGGMWGGG